MLVRLLPAAAVLAAFGCGGAPENGGAAETAQLTAPPEIREMDVDGVADRLAAGEDIFLLDVRNPDEIEEHGAIEGYVNIPIDELEGRLAEVPRDKPIVAY